jgi:3-hydroxyacyl-[acyl-carrier-protein] dehydratase
MNSRELYTYKIKLREEALIHARISIHEQHPIYEGHFPGLPITPGVCQVQIIKEILEEGRGISLRLCAAKQIKFTAVHEPGVAPEIDAEISFSQEDERFMVSARLHKNEKVYLKFKGEYRTQK